ncbi:MAG: hypothetical protein Q7R79_00680 [bacterium]|nr:hypothetical protein [bacterium]
MTTKILLKDEVMKNLTERGVNVASFVSFGPDGKQRFCRVRGFHPHKLFTDYESAVRAMYATGYIDLVNVRTFLPEKPDGNPFFLGVKHGFKDPSVVARFVAEHIQKGFHVIINEDVPVDDGGFSGVVMGDTVEFAACETPRCVDRDDPIPCAKLSLKLTRRLVSHVYGCNFILPFSPAHRVEFSVHPGPVGYFGTKIIIWQAEDMLAPSEVATPMWPNRYSVHMGDKAFGLLMAWLHDFPVPHTQVFGRVIPPFSFGDEVHSGEGCWIRTCPRRQEPGRYTTKRGWLDPFMLMEQEDPERKYIAAIIAQQGIKAGYSGAAITGSDGNAIIEGKEGRGDKFMLGEVGAAELPKNVAHDVLALWYALRETFGVVRFEWVYDSYHRKAWIVQLHGGASQSVGSEIYPGEAVRWVDFKVPGDLEDLRFLSKQAREEKFGIRLVGNIGITSHPCDILRRDKIPSRLSRV